MLAWTGGLGDWWEDVMRRLGPRQQRDYRDGDHEYDRKLALMERRLDELGSAVEVAQRDLEPERPWVRPHVDHPRRDPESTG